MNRVLRRFLTSTTPTFCVVLWATAGSVAAQTPLSATPIATAGCPPKTAIEFIAPAPGEKLPIVRGSSPFPETAHVILEIATDQIVPERIPVDEALYLPAPGDAPPLLLPTDVNGDGIPGDPHPAMPDLVVSMDDVLVNLATGTTLPPGTNIASLFEMLGSEIEHGGDQSITVSWALDPARWEVIDIDGSMATLLEAKIHSADDFVLFEHFSDPIFGGLIQPQTPTITIFTADWISTVDSDIPGDGETPWVLGIEVRIPTSFDFGIFPPAPVPLDPLPGPCGGAACTGFFPPFPGPGSNPAFPTLDVRFSDDYFDATTATFVMGGTASGGDCAAFAHTTGDNLAFAFQQASVHSWFGCNGVPDTTFVGGGDDQLIYRYTMVVDGVIFDSDALPEETMVTASIATLSGCFSTTNLRIKHRRDVRTP